MSQQKYQYYNAILDASLKETELGTRVLHTPATTIIVCHRSMRFVQLYSNNLGDYNESPKKVYSVSITEVRLHILHDHKGHKSTEI